MAESYKTTKKWKKPLGRVKLPKNEAFKNRIKSLVLEKYNAEQEFFKKLGISRQAYWQISWGIWKPGLNNMIRIAKELNVDSRELWV